MFSIDTRNMAPIRSFHMCQTHFEYIPKPKKDIWQENERPLDSPRKYHMRLVKYSPSHYACRLYNTDMVTYHRDGPLIVRLVDTVSSMKFLRSTLPDGLNAWSHRGQCMLSLNFNQHGEPTQWIFGDRIVLAKDPHDKWIILDGAKQRYREFVNRQKSKEVRASVKPFVDWWKAASNVVEFGYQGYLPRDFTSLLDDRDQWGVLAGYVGTPRLFHERLYDLHKVRELHEIPNTEQPKRGRLEMSS
jgi:hypothetical protein